MDRRVKILTGILCMLFLCCINSNPVSAEEVIYSEGTHYYADVPSKKDDRTVIMYAPANRDPEKAKDMPKGVGRENREDAAHAYADTEGVYDNTVSGNDPETGSGEAAEESGEMGSGLGTGLGIGSATEEEENPLLNEISKQTVISVLENTTVEEQKRYELREDNYVLMGDFNNDGTDDLYVVEKTDTLSENMEVHILNGKDDYETYLDYIATTVPGDEVIDVQLGDYNEDGIPDLLVLTAGDKEDEWKVVVLNGKKRYSKTIFEKKLPVDKMEEDSYLFRVGDYNADGIPDIFLLQTTEEKKVTQVYVLNGKKKYKKVILDEEIELSISGKHKYINVGDFDGDGIADIYIFKLDDTDSKTVEVTILSGKSNYSKKIDTRETDMKTTEDPYEFSVTEPYSDVYALKKTETKDGLVSSSPLMIMDDLTLSESALEEAKKYIGLKYVWGGESLTRGTDCSGFVKAIYAKYGISLPHSSYKMRTIGKAVSVKNMQPGDIVCYNGHVGFYAGNGKLLSALGKKYGVTQNSVYYSKIITVRRLTN